MTVRTTRIVRNTPLLSALAKMHLELWLRQRYPKGPLMMGNPTPISAAREMLETVVKGLNHWFEKEHSEMRVAIDSDHSRYIPSTISGGIGVVKSLIIFDGEETFLRDLTVSPTLVRLADCRIFTDPESGVIQLLDAILMEAEQATIRIEAVAS